LTHRRTARRGDRAGGDRLARWAGDRNRRVGTDSFRVGLRHATADSSSISKGPTSEGKPLRHWQPVVPATDGKSGSCRPPLFQNADICAPRWRKYPRVFVAGLVIIRTTMTATAAGNPTSTSRDVILALFQGYDFEVARPFLESLRATGYRGRVIFVGSELSANTRRQLRDAGVEIVWFSRWSIRYPKQRNGRWQWRRMYPLTRLASIWPTRIAVRWIIGMLLRCRDEGDVMWQAKLAVPFVHYFCARFAVYSRLLAERSDEFDRLFLADVRDKVFQRDPFAWDVPSDRLACFSEQPGMTIGQCRFTSRWIRNGIGQRAVDEVADEQLLCAGTTMGPTDAMRRYLAALVRQMLMLRKQVNGIDQGTHNYIVHTGKAGPWRMYMNHDGPVINLGRTPEARLRFNDSDQLVNDDDSVIAVVHQFDRLTTKQQRRFQVLRDTGVAT